MRLLALFRLYDTQHNDTQNNGSRNNASMLFLVPPLYWFAECHYAECRYAECRCAVIHLSSVVKFNILSRNKRN
jgi:hypothetical protein